MREDAGDLLDLAVQSGLLVELPNDGGIRMLAEIDAAAGKRPRPDIDLERRQPGEQDPAGVVATDPIGAEARAPAGGEGLRHGRIGHVRALMA
jgi:hypothetical protein